MRADIMRYPIEVFWSDEDEGFIAIAPDLPGASAWGKSETEAIKELHTVIDLWLKAAKRTGNPVPKPSDRADVNYSGKFLMRVPKRLHADLARAAEAQSVSLNQYVLYLLTKGHGERAQVRSVEHGEISLSRVFRAVDPARGSDGQVALCFSVAGAGSKANPSRSASCRRR